MTALRGLADENQLCLRTLGFEKSGKGACFRHQIKRCAGACAGQESLQIHQARVAAALAGLKTAAWPWRGPIGIIEEDREREAAEVHVVDNWCLLGTAKSEDGVGELLEGTPRPRFDLDHYKILARHLAAGRAKVVELGARIAPVGH